jgi:hypothetical protein
MLICFSLDASILWLWEVSKIYFNFIVVSYRKSTNSEIINLVSRNFVFILILHRNVPRLDWGVLQNRSGIKKKWEEGLYSMYILKLPAR